MKYSKGKLSHGSYGVHGHQSRILNLTVYCVSIKFPHLLTFSSHEIRGTVNYGSFINQQSIHKGNKTPHQKPDGRYLLN